MKKNTFMIVFAMALTVVAQEASSLGFSGNGSDAAVGLMGLGRWYALEGNNIVDSINANIYQGPNSLRPDRPLPANGIRMIREVAKLDVRAESDPNYISAERFQNAISVFAGRSLEHHIRTALTGDPLRGLSLPEPDPASLYASEAHLIAQRIAADQESQPAWPDTIYWEIGNEPNLFPWIRPSIYADIFQQYYKGIKDYSPEAKVGVSLHDNDLIQNELNYFVDRMVEDQTEQRIKDATRFSENDLKTLGVGGGLVLGGPAGAATGFFSSVFFDDALDKAKRDTRNAVKRMFQQYSDDRGDHALKSTQLYFRSILHALPDTSIPDFIGLHTYPIDVIKKQGLEPMLNAIDILITGLQLEWVARYAPSDLERLQTLVNANVRTDLTAEDVTTPLGIRKIPPVLITEFGNISPESVVIKELADTLVLPNGQDNHQSPSTITIGATMYGGGCIQRKRQIDQGDIVLIRGSVWSGDVFTSACRLTVDVDDVWYEDIRYHTYEFNPAYAQNLALSMMDRFAENPNIHAWLLFEPENADPKFSSFGLSPAYSRIFNNVTTTVWDNYVAGNICNDLNELGLQDIVWVTKVFPSFSA